MSRRLVSGVVRSYGTAPQMQRWRDNIVLVDAARTPFNTSSTAFARYKPVDLAREALRGLLRKTGIDPALVDYVVMGTVLQEVKTSNVAREAAMQAGLPLRVAAHTVTQACISANQALTTVMAQISSGMCSVGIAGGVESMSDVPIRYSPAVRQRMLAARKIKSPLGYFSLLSGLSLSDLAPETPPIAEFSTGETMGHSADRLAAAFGVTRTESDQFALRSHANAKEAHDKGYFTDLLSVKLPGKSGVSDRDNGVRVSDMATLGRLKPSFVKPNGTVTAANASFLTDGASAALIMTEARAKELGLTPKAYLRQYFYVAQDPKDQLLLGPAYVTPRLLDATGLTLKDISVFELHEAFAGQVLANLRALESPHFAKEHMGRSAPVGTLDMTRLNNWGGSLSIGHPFGATGTRLVNTAANRLLREDGRFALVAACAAGGLGHGMIIERHPSARL